ncbi:hypothetical protein ACIBEJ_00900 [Nonomuraea sp. NPDC050790]|uniref:hypothetical protein n=1 Tax=Nonomuraea sp. NPDC050790 TaxID=3364371 RepID=UPI00378FDF2D
MRTDEMCSPARGDAVIIDGKPGVYLTLLAGDALATAQPALVGRIRVQRIWDGAGPSHQSTTASLGEVTLIVGGYVDTPPGDDHPLEIGYRLTAGTSTRRADLVIPRNPAAHADDEQIVDAARVQQFDLGLNPDAHVVTRIPTGWAKNAEPAAMPQAG